MLTVSDRAIMPSGVLLFTAMVLVWIVLSNLIPLYHNIRAAKATGLVYRVVPYYQYNFILARFMSKTLLPVLDRYLPAPAITSWRRLVSSLWPLKLRHAPFKAFGTDTFLIVAPGGILFNTADASVIAQVLSRGNEFPKAIDIYKQIEIYGRNVVSSEGPAWRYHRKLTSPAFSEKNNQLVWKETLGKSQAMLSKLIDHNSKPKTVTHLANYTMRLSLEVLGRAGLGERLEWPTQTDDGSPPAKSFTSALEYVSRHIVTLMIVNQIRNLLPKCLLRNFPVAWIREGQVAYEDWELRMQEMISTRREAIKFGSCDTSATDLVGQLVKGQDDESDEETKQLFTLTDSEVLGNLFVFMVAGHETSAHTIHFTLVLLALNPLVQRKVQEELDGILQGRPASSWSFEEDLPQLLNGLLGASLSESLRVISPVLTIPKVILEPRTLRIDGKDVVIPASTLFRLCIPGVHRNPKFWPHCSPANGKNPIFPLDNHDNDLEEFKPERWFVSQNGLPEFLDGGVNTADEQALPILPNSSQYPRPITPTKGSYIPFSDGQRSCLGRRFAQVEILAALAVILSEYSVELAVDEWANDEQVAAMSYEEQRTVWGKAHDTAQALLRDKMTCIITVQLVAGVSIPLRFVPKGEERFVL